MAVQVTRWAEGEPPDIAALREALRHESHTFSEWSNGPADTYAPHAHRYDKLLVCLRGSITFTLGATGETVALAAGDRLFLPAQTLHGAVVGPSGVVCAEAHLPCR